MSDSGSDAGGSPRGAATARSGPTAGADDLDPASLPALFWDEMPERPEEHPDYMGLQALAEECTPEERADNFKVGPLGGRGGLCVWGCGWGGVGSGGEGGGGEEGQGLCRWAWAWLHGGGRREEGRG